MIYKPRLDKMFDMMKVTGEGCKYKDNRPQKSHVTDGWCSYRETEASLELLHAPSPYTLEANLQNTQRIKHMTLRH